MGHGRKTLMVVEHNSVGAHMLRSAHAAGLSTVLLTRDTGQLRVPDELIPFCEHIVRTETNEYGDAVAAALDFARAHPVHAVFPGHEYQVPLTADIARRLGLVGHAEEIVPRLRDKYEMKASFQQGSVPVAGFVKATSPEEALSRSAGFGFPRVVKPSNGGGSQNVIRVDTVDQLLAAVRKCQSYRTHRISDRLLSSEVLVEEFVSGREVSVETISIQGEHHILAITDKIVGCMPYFVELGHTVPSNLPDSIQRQIRALVPRALNAVGLQDGPSHLEIKIVDDSEDALRVVEVAGRVGGDQISRLVALATGDDIMRCTLDVLIHRQVQLVRQNRGVAAIRFLYPEHPGRIAAIDTQGAADAPHIVELRMLKRAGDSIDLAGDNYDRIAYAIAFASDYAEACAAAENAIRRVRVEILAEDHVQDRELA